MIITTKYTVNDKGAGRVVAKGNGKQRTLPFDHGSSIGWNHGQAAGHLALALGLKWTDNVVHVSQDDQTHKFIFP